MNVARLGLAPLKGTRHEDRQTLQLTAEGPAGDRDLCLVDPQRRTVVRTVHHPELMQVRLRVEGTEVTADFPGSTVVASPQPDGEILECDYWGRTEPVQPLDSPLADSFSRFLGREVLLGLARRQGAVVYGAPVTLVMRSDLDELGRRSGAADLAAESARFRATMTVDDRDEPIRWDAAGRLEVGEAVLELTGPIPRCTLIDRNPKTGEADRPLLKTLAEYRHAAGEIWFGHYARVLVAGRCRVGDDVHRGA